MNHAETPATTESQPPRNRDVERLETEVASLRTRLFASEQAMKVAQESLRGIMSAQSARPSQEAFDRLQAKNDGLEQEVRELSEILRKLQTDVVITAVSSRGVEVERDALMAGWVELKSSARLHEMTQLTPRLLLFSADYNSRDHGQTGEGFLDTPLNAADSLRLALRIRANRLTQTPLELIVCCICEIPRVYEAVDPANPQAHLSEFVEVHKTTGCCKRPICKHCLPSAFKRSLVAAAWDQDSINDRCIVRCLAGATKFGSCGSSHKYRYEGDLDRIFTTAEYSEADVASMYNYIWLSRLLGDKRRDLAESTGGLDFGISRLFRNRLTELGLMKNPFEVCFRDDNTINLAPLQTVILDVRVNPDRPAQVPVFKGLINGVKARECTICAEVYEITHLPPTTQWQRMRHEFSGTWYQDIVDFPPRDLLSECNTAHALDICKGCLSRHIETRLEVEPGSEITCPVPDCTHAYHEYQIRALAGEDICTRYTRLKLVGFLRGEPNFRWCLRQNCEFGELHDVSCESTNRISCSRCRFEMCYRHQVPWHRGLSCALYDYIQTLHAGETERWIAVNTRPCPGPGCGVSIQKNSGCAHMTCRACRHEFCWGCGRPWTQAHFGTPCAIAGAENAEQAENLWWVRRDQ